MNDTSHEEPASEAEQLVLLRQFAAAIRRHADVRGVSEVVDLIDNLDAVAAEIQGMQDEAFPKPRRAFLIPRQDGE